MITIPIEVSGRHVHLSVEDWYRCFGTAEPTSSRPLSQLPQYVAQERVQIIGPEGRFDRVAMVGPLRAYTQVELTQTDARILGLQLPLRQSGDLKEAASISIVGPKGSVQSPAAIRQRRHIHAGPTDAAAHRLHDGQIASVTVGGDRGGRFDQVVVRVAAGYTWRMHVDTDEANAFGIVPGTIGRVEI